MEKCVLEGTSQFSVIGQTLPCFPDIRTGKNWMVSEGSYMVAASIVLFSDIVVKRETKLHLSGNANTNDRIVFCGGHQRASLYAVL